LEKQRQDIMAQQLVPLPPLKLSRSEEALKRLQDPAKLDFAGDHNLFNPVPWQKTPDGRLIKVPKTGRTNQVEVIQVTKLYLTVTLSQETMNASGYLITVENEAEARPADRKKSGYVTLDLKPARLPLKLREVKGPPEKPDQLILELTDTGKPVSVAFGQPYRHVAGYTATLKAENKTWANRREGEKFVAGGEEFTLERINLVATNQFEVILSAKSTGKRSIIKFEKKEDDTPKAAGKPSAAP
jgi:hypothetical protein